MASDFDQPTQADERERTIKLIRRVGDAKLTTQRVVAQQLLDERLKGQMDVALERAKKRAALQELPVDPRVTTQGYAPNGKYVQLTVDDSLAASEQSVHSYLRLGAVPNPSQAGQASSGAHDSSGEDLAAEITTGGDAFADDSLDRAVDDADAPTSEPSAETVATQIDDTKAKLTQQNAAIRQETNGIAETKRKMATLATSGESFADLAHDLAGRERKLLEAQQGKSDAQETMTDLLATQARQAKMAALKTQVDAWKAEAAKRKLAASEQAKLASAVAQLEKLGPPLHCPGYLTKAIRKEESKKLHTKGGWREHTEGNRITTTRGDKVEVVYGNYRLMSLGHQKQNAGWDLSGGHVSQSGGGDTAATGGGAQSSGAVTGGAAGGGRMRTATAGSGTGPRQTGDLAGDKSGSSAGVKAGGKGGATAGGKTTQGPKGAAKGGGGKGGGKKAGGAGNSGMSWVQNWGGNWRTVSESTKGDNESTTAGDSITRNFGKLARNVSGCERPWERYLLELAGDGDDKLTADDLASVQRDVARGEHVLSWFTTGAGAQQQPHVSEAQVAQLRKDSETLELADDCLAEGVIDTNSYLVASGAATTQDVPAIEQLMATFLASVEPSALTTAAAMKSQFDAAAATLAQGLVARGLVTAADAAGVSQTLWPWFEERKLSAAPDARGELSKAPGRLVDKVRRTVDPEGVFGTVSDEEQPIDAAASRDATQRLAKWLGAHKKHATWREYAKRYELRYAANSNDASVVWKGDAHAAAVDALGSASVEALQRLVDTGKTTADETRKAALRKNAIVVDRTWAKKITSYTGSASTDIMPAKPPTWLVNRFKAMEPPPLLDMPEWMIPSLASLTPRQVSAVPPWVFDPFALANRAVRNLAATPASGPAPAEPLPAEEPRTSVDGAAPAAPAAPADRPALPDTLQARGTAKPKGLRYGNRKRELVIPMPPLEQVMDQVDFADLAYFYMTGHSPWTYPYAPPASKGCVVPLMKNHTWAKKTISKTVVGDASVSGGATISADIGPLAKLGADVMGYDLGAASDAQSTDTDAMQSDTEGGDSDSDAPDASAADKPSVSKDEMRSSGDQGDIASPASDPSDDGGAARSFGPLQMGESRSETWATLMLSNTTIDETQTSVTKCTGAMESTTNVRRTYSLTSVTGVAKSTTQANTSSTTIGDSNSVTVGSSSNTTLAATSNVTVGASADLSLSESLSITIGALSSITIALKASVLLGASASLNIGVPDVEVNLTVKDETGGETKKFTLLAVL